MVQWLAAKRIRTVNRSFNKNIGQWSPLTATKGARWWAFFIPVKYANKGNAHV
jgi:hypothetical protein